MDGHDSDGVVRCRTGRLRELGPLLTKRFHIADELEQAACAAGLITGNHFREAMDIGHALLAVAHCAEDVLGVGAVENFREDLAELVMRDEAAELRDHLDEVFCLFALLCVNLQGFIECRGVLFRDADLCKLVCRKSDERRREHGDERNVLRGVIQDLQERIERRDFGRIHDGAVLRRLRGDADVSERLDVVRRRALGGLHEDGNILCPNAAHLTGGLVHDGAVIEHIADAGGDVFRLDIDLGDRLHVFVTGRRCRRRLGVDGNELDGVILSRDEVRAARLERFVVSVGKAADRLGHARFHDGIRCVKDFGAAAEVLAQQDAARLPIRRLGVVLVGVVVTEEDGGVSQAEAVDALLDVADHKAVLAVGNRVEDSFLYAVRILKLVDHDFRDSCGNGLGDVRLLMRRFIEQEADGHVLQVAEIEHVVGFLFRLEARVEIGDEREHAADGALCALEVCEDFLGWAVDALELFIDRLFVARADALDLLLQRLGHVGVLADGLELCPAAVLDKEHGVPIRIQDVFKLDSVLVDGGAVGRGERFIAVADVLRCADERKLRADVLFRRTDDISAPGCLGGVRVLGDIHVVEAFGDPLSGPRMRLDGIVDGVDDGRHGGVVSAVGEFFDERLLVRVLVDVFIERFERVFHRGGAQDLCLLLFGDAEVTREPSLGAVRTQER